MPAGLEVYNASGGLLFKGTDRMVRFLGTVQFNKVNGSVTDARLLTGQVVVVLAPQMFEDRILPTLTTTTNGFSWSYGTTAAALRADAMAFYGVF